MQQQRTLDYADAQKALTVIVAELQRRNAIGVIAVVWSISRTYRSSCRTCIIGAHDEWQCPQRELRQT